MYSGSLFERLSSNFNPNDYDNEDEAIYASIANNLSKIFSTNAGSSEISKDYGRPDLNNIDFSMNDSIEIIEKSSELCIKKYEPRLYKAKVAVSKQKLILNEMNIYIEGHVFINGKSKRINYRADLLKNGKVKIYKDGI
ncbi:type VI secretion system baseplate subunit TssE [Arcobacter sp.]|uniref:type VI secretion system baseplate subunit TssE n=1 Tax=unclassified Arcobacter TaxID=2593671 RepID=UPI003B002F88